MISDQERREVARRLRADWAMFRRRGTERVPLFTMQCMDQLLRAIGLIPERCDWQTIAFRLASLIDRPTCRNVYDDAHDEYEGGCCENGFKCSKCGELVEDCEGYRVKGTFNYCPNCGAEVVPDGC